MLISGTINIGDELIEESGYFSCTRRIVKVASVSPSGIVLDDGCHYKLDGTAMVSSGIRSTGVLSPLTPELRDEIAKKNEETALRNWQSWQKESED